MQIPIDKRTNDLYSVSTVKGNELWMYVRAKVLFSPKEGNTNNTYYKLI